MRRPAPHHRPGFTLVELMMVIIIIGILASLLIVAARPALTAAANARVAQEVGQLDVAMNNFKNDHGGAVPPALGTADTFNMFVLDPTLEVAYTQRLMRFLRKAFPRFRLTDLNGSGDVDLDDMAQLIEDLYPLDPSFYVTTNYLDFTQLDAAESLVLWLGGMPHVTQADDNGYTVELTRFARDPANPFLPEFDPTGNNLIGQEFQPERTDTVFEFDTRRLVDSDREGWPGYVAEVEDTPPYAYFDAAAYGLFPHYPPFTHPRNDNPANNDDEWEMVQDSWGFARPYLKSYAAQNPSGSQAVDAFPSESSFGSAEAFQILCAGNDNRFSNLTALDAGTLQLKVMQLCDYPAASYLQFGFPPPLEPTSVDAEEFDNLGNFLEGKLESNIED